MKDWPQAWDDLFKIMHRVCEHRIVHPDPDHVRFEMDKWGDKLGRWRSIHECDGCCVNGPEGARSIRADRTAIGGD